MMGEKKVEAMRDVNVEEQIRKLHMKYGEKK